MAAGCPHRYAEIMKNRPGRKDFLRQAAALVVGLVSGVLPLVQLGGFMAYACVVLLGCVAFYRYVLK